MLPDGWKKTVASGALFNASWLAIVASESYLVAPLVVVAHLALHFAVFSRCQREWAFIAGVALVGVSLDQLLFAIGLFTLNGQAALAPLWLSCLWPVLATTFNHAFRGLQDRPMLAAVLGAGGGAGSYLAGTRISAVDFGDPVLGLAAIAVLWALLFPALALLCRAVTLGRAHVATS